MNKKRLTNTFLEEFEIYDFNKQKQLIEKKAEKVGQTSLGKKSFGKYETVFPLKRTIEEDE
ncbi:MAG: hypothetical protein ACFFC1_17270, partial [Promethearchaeota archaeon]